MGEYERIHLTLPKRLLEKARQAAGDLPFSRYMARALEAQLKVDVQVREILQAAAEERKP